MTPPRSFSHGAVDGEGFVDQRRLVDAGLALPDQSHIEPGMHVPRGIAVADDVFALLDREGRDAFDLGWQCRDGALQVGVEPLVGIEHQAPWPLALLQRELLLARETRPFALDQADGIALGAIRFDQLDGAVSRSGIDDDDLPAKIDAFDARSDCIALVLADDEDGHGNSCRRGRLRVPLEGSGHVRPAPSRPHGGARFGFTTDRRDALGSAFGRANEGLFHQSRQVA